MVWAARICRTVVPSVQVEPPEQTEVDSVITTLARGLGTAVTTCRKVFAPMAAGKVPALVTTL